MKNHRLLLFGVLTSSVLLSLGLESAAVPPDPRVYGVRADQGLYVMSNTIPEMTESKASPPADSAVGTQETVAILIEFQDATHDPARDVAYFDDHLFSESNPYSMYSYYHEVSYGQALISGVITGWHRSQRNMSYYGTDGYKMDRLNGPVYELAREAIRLADAAGFDFSQYDKDQDGFVDHIIIVHAGPGQEMGGGPYGPNAIWSHHWSISPHEQVDGVRACHYSMVSESSPLGTLAHEFGHDLGLPDLCDSDNSSVGIGFWGIMGYGAWLMGGDIPAHFCAWSKVFLGWVEPKEVNTDEVGLVLNCVEQNNRDAIVKILLTTDEYFLLENRYETGFDQYMPGSGVLIWHIDDSVGEIDYNDVSDDENHKRVDLEEADGRDDLDRNLNYGDYTDPYYLDNAMRFGPDTVPDSRLYSGENSNVNVLNISDSGPVMTLDILFTPNLAPVAVASGPYTCGVNERIRFDGSGSYDIDGDPLKYMWDFDASDGIQVDSTDDSPAYKYTAVGDYVVTLIVSDGNADSDPSTIMVEVRKAERIAISLTAGWNLISLCLQPINADCASVLSSVEGKYHSIWTYNAASGKWKRYVADAPSFLNDLSEMESSLGYWVMMNQPGTLIVYGVQPSTSIPLKAGWNLIGYNSQTPISIEDYLSGVDGKCNSIWAYESDSGKWLRYKADSPAFLNSLEYLEPGRGYWIDMKEDHIWNMSYSSLFSKSLN